VVALALLTSTASAGGLVASGYGMGAWVPGSNLLLTWSWYGPGQTEPLVNELSYAVASVDADALQWRLLWDDTPDPDRVHIYFSFKGNDAVSAGCLDEVPGNCELAMTQCQVWTQDGPLKICTQYRILLRINNIAVKGPPEERLEGIVRHELAHVLGFEHGDGGPMSDGLFEFTECQQAQWDAYQYDPAVTGWTVMSIPECSE
jgi:hypothetical protein